MNEAVVAGTPRGGLVSVDDAYRHCFGVACAHYENFTLGSWLLPRPLRRHIAAIYAFARAADDFADEGDAGPAERLARLDEWELRLAESVAGEARDPVFVALGHTIRVFDLPIEPFRKLVEAFRMDATFRGFQDFPALKAYCRCSADPVGHLILCLFGYRDETRRALADRICTGLQLANFCQDVGIDVARGRLYIPADEFAESGCTLAEVRRGILTAPLRRLFAAQAARARGLLTEGLELAGMVDRCLAREVSLFAWGGLVALDAIEAVDFDVFRRRPRVSRATKLRLVIRALGLRGSEDGGGRGTSAEWRAGRALN